MKLYVIRGKDRMRPIMRINMRSGFCAGAQWQTAFDTRNRNRGVQFGGSNCVRSITIAEQIKHYLEYLKARGWLADWVAEWPGAAPIVTAHTQLQTLAVEHEQIQGPFPASNS